MEEKSQERHERRQRKKKLVSDVRQLLEFYFSPANLNKDLFMKELLAKSPFIDLSVFQKFNKLKSLTTDTTIIKKAIKTSEVLKLSDSQCGVGRIEPYVEKTNETECTIYVEHLPPHAEHDWIRNVFSQYGTIDYISLPRFKQSGRPKGFAFVEFSLVDEAQRALAAFGGASFPENATKPEDLLLSIKTHNKDETEPAPTTSKREREESPEEGEVSSSKRAKKDEDTQADVQSKKKKKRKRTKKEKEYEGDIIYLRVMSKQEWKSLRNTYLDTQRHNHQGARQAFSNYNYFPTTFSTQDHFNPPPTTKSNLPEYTPNVIVKIVKNPPLLEVVDYRKALLDKFSQIAYIDAKPGIPNIFIRLKSAEAAVELIQAEGQEGKIIDGAEEALYWEHVFASWTKTRPKKKKQPDSRPNPDSTSRPGTYRNPWGKKDESHFVFE